MVCAAIAAVTERLEFLVAFRPGFVLPTLAAQQAATFQQLLGGRLRLNIVTGGDPAEQRAYGDFLDHDARYARTGEFLDVLRRSFTGVPFDFAGEHVRVEGGRAEDAGRRPADLPGWRLAGGRGRLRPPRRHLPDLGRAAGDGRARGRPRAGEGGRRRP